jgi:hypothetical protein
MSTWIHQLHCEGRPDEVLALLTEAEAIERWSPVPFELGGLGRGRLRAGDRIDVRGALAGAGAAFAVTVEQAGPERLALTAAGPIDLEVEYIVTADGDGSRLFGSIAVAGRGLRGRLLASATDALLAAGALRLAMERIAGELQSSPLLAA